MFCPDPNPNQYDNTPVDIEYSITIDGGKYVLKAITMAKQKGGILNHYYPVMVIYPTPDSGEPIQFLQIDDDKVTPFTTQNKRLMKALQQKSIVFTYELEEEIVLSPADATTTNTIDKSTMVGPSMSYAM
jgi:hypothetical protein